MLWATGVLPALPAPPGTGRAGTRRGRSWPSAPPARDRLQAAPDAGAAAARAGQRRGSSIVRRPRSVRLHGAAVPARGVGLPDRRRLPRPRGLRHPGEPRDRRPRRRAERRRRRSCPSPAARGRSRCSRRTRCRARCRRPRPSRSRSGMQVGVTARQHDGRAVAMMLLFRTSARSARCARPERSSHSAPRRSRSATARPRSLASSPGSRPTLACASEVTLL